MAFMPVNRGNDEYATAPDLISQDDRPEMDVRVPAWHRSNGKAAILRLKSLGLTERQWINITAGAGEKRNEKTFILATICKGVIKPAMTWEQAQLLGDRNEQVLEILADTIWEMSALDQNAIDALVEELAGSRLPDGPKQAAA